MTQPRQNIVSLDDTPFYHCMSRCVRRAFLCGIDHYSGNNYEHRRDWLENKLHEVASVFAIKLCAYAIMSNHYHVVLHVRSDVAAAWSDREVVEQWHKLYAGNLLSSRFLKGIALDEQETKLLNKDISTWRQRLCSISWFMRVVNEFIAIKANREDDCTGRFWEGRFKSQALLDEKALLSCMAYVDLNPIRAAMATTPETAEFTCVRARILAKKGNMAQPCTIEAFIGSAPETLGLPFNLDDYLELVDWTGRILKKEQYPLEYKRGSIPSNLPSILQRLEFNADAWAILSQDFETQFSHWVGSEQIVKKVYQDRHYQRIPRAKNYANLLG